MPISLSRPPSSSGGGSNDKYYLHTQTVPANTWIVNHNFGKYPSVTILDSTGEEMLAEIDHISVNQIIISFGELITGKVICN